MRAAIFEEPGRVVPGERPDAALASSTDAVVRVVLACVCGTDLWYYRGETDFPRGGPIGHEFIGVVEEVGADVTQVRRGDLVIAPFWISDNTCPNCRHGIHTACVNGMAFPRQGDGGQGEAVRVPYADGTLVPVPGSGHSDAVLRSLLTLSDVMSTGHHAAVCAHVKAGDTVAVVGDGAVGLSAVLAARRLGAERIIALSRHEPRQDLARAFGATDIVAARGDEGIAEVMELTGGVGVDAALECVGTGQAVSTAFAISRPGSTIGYVGIPHGVELEVPKMFYKNVGIQGGPAPARAYIPELLPDVLEERINPGLVLDSETDLEGIADAYSAMDGRSAIKSLVRISSV